MGGATSNVLDMQIWCMDVRGTSLHVPITVYRPFGLLNGHLFSLLSSLCALSLCIFTSITFLCDL